MGGGARKGRLLERPIVTGLRDVIVEEVDEGNFLTRDPVGGGARGSHINMREREERAMELTHS
jgi:hypothetical protein